MARSDTGRQRNLPRGDYAVENSERRLKLSGIIARALGPFQEFGLLAGALYILDRFLRSTSPSVGLYAYELMVQPIKRQPILAPNRLKTLRFVRLVRGDADIALMPAREEIKEQRFSQGAQCLAVYRHEHLLGYLWFCLGKYDEDEVRCTYELFPADRSAFDFDVYVMPKHRMGIAFVAVWHAANEFLREQGVQYSFSRVSRFNALSRRSHAQLGAYCIGRVVFVQAWAVELMMATVFPYVALTWSPSSRAHLRLSAGDRT